MGADAPSVKSNQLKCAVPIACLCKNCSNRSLDSPTFFPQPEAEKYIDCRFGKCSPASVAGKILRNHLTRLPVFPATLVCGVTKATPRALPRFFTFEPLQQYIYICSGDQCRDHSNSQSFVCSESPECAVITHNHSQWNIHGAPLEQGWPLTACHPVFPYKLWFESGPCSLVTTDTRQAKSRHEGT